MALETLPFRAVLESVYNETPGNRHYCNYLVYAAAKKLGIHLPPGLSADGLIDHLSKFWFTIRDMAEAEKRADRQFVIAGLKAADHKPPCYHGHVAVLIPRTTQPEHKRLGHQLALCMERRKRAERGKPFDRIADMVARERQTPEILYTHRPNANSHCATVLSQLFR